MAHIAASAQLKALGAKRAAARWDGFACIGDFHAGNYDCLWVSPYTRSANNPHADVVILLQDWASTDWFQQPFDEEVARLGYDPALRTNQNLHRLLKEHLDQRLEDTYATNLFPFVKLGGMSAKIPVRALRRAAVEYALPQVDAVRPRLVVCLGNATFNAISFAAGEPLRPRLAEAIASPFRRGRTLIHCQAHTSQLGQNLRNRHDPTQVARDWVSMHDRFAEEA